MKIEAEPYLTEIARKTHKPPRILPPSPALTSRTDMLANKVWIIIKLHTGEIDLGVYLITF